MKGCTCHFWEVAGKSFHIQGDDRYLYPYLHSVFIFNVLSVFIFNTNVSYHTIFTKYKNTKV